MTDLITKLESAERGSRELDAEIAQYLGHDWQWQAGPGEGFWSCLMGGDWVETPYYTTSLGAARKLGGTVVFASDIGADGLPMVEILGDTSLTPVPHYVGIAATLELAWCIAALKAREAQDG